MKRRSGMLLLLAIISGLALARFAAAQNGPPGSIGNPKQITSADRGPDIDPVKLAQSPFSSVPAFNTFRGFISGCYAIGNVWVYAEKDDPKLYDTDIAYVFPTFYKPTWGEVFDHVARQMKCSWSWNPENRQFKFARSDGKPAFGVKLADGWQIEDRGLYVWHAPKGQSFGLDIYYFGHYTADPADPELYNKVRGYFATVNLKGWPGDPTEQKMSKLKIGEAEALYIKTDTPRPGGVWRQWCLVMDGNAFLIVSAMPKEKEDQLAPMIEKMVPTFSLAAPATRPAIPVK